MDLQAISLNSVLDDVDHQIQALGEVTIVTGDREVTVKVRLIQTGDRKIRGQGHHHPSPGGHVSKVTGHHHQRLVDRSYPQNVPIKSGRSGHHCRGNLEIVKLSLI